MRKSSNVTYLILSAAALVCGIVAVFIVAFMCSTGAPVSRSNVLDDNAEEVLARVVQTTSFGQYSDEEIKEQVDFISCRINSGAYTLGDYVLTSFTSSTYLMGNVTDEVFVRDFMFVMTGEVDEDDASDYVEEIEGKSRKFFMAEYIREMDEGDIYLVSTDIEDEEGSSFLDCVITSQLEGSAGYTVGVRRVEGNFQIDGEEVRTDFFVDGVLHQGALTIDNEADSNRQNFVVSWDTAGLTSGMHDVLILLRSSDGRGQIIEGGQINVPSFLSIMPNGVSLGTIRQNYRESWYRYDAGESNSYVNFVDCSDDIKVTLYDLYGNIIGTNDLPDSDIEVLRGLEQDVELAREETGIDGLSNVYYIHVERGATCESLSDEISYTMVQTRDVARYDGAYMAVVPPEDLTSTSEYTLVDLSGNTYELSRDNFSILPINGKLLSFDVREFGNGYVVGIIPLFDIEEENYGYYNDRGATSICVNADALEGYAATVSILVGGPGASQTEVYQGQEIVLPAGEVEIEVKVTSFDGLTNTYTLYLLNGDDQGEFCEDTLSNFPTSYYSGLWLLHSLHPAYKFRAYNTGLDYYTVLDNEDHYDRSLASGYTHPNWVVPSSPIYDGGGWMQASYDVVNYFLDPRNYLSERRVFAFEMLSFDSTSHTREGIEAMVEGSFLDDDSIDYVDILYEAGQTANVSPYFLVSRIIQEMGYSGQSALCHGTLEGYEGYYNFYNIGSTPDPSIENGALINGARYAMWGLDPDEEEITDVEASLMLPWNSPERAITGGALWIASRYTAAGQDTLYFQKFDVIDNEDGLYQHQYAQNISMAYTEGARYYDGYEAIGMLDQPFMFLVPVYNNMPSSYGYLPEGDI